MPEEIAGVRIPDSALAREATAFVRDVETDLLYHHSRRTFLFGSLRGAEKGLSWDPELLYVGAMFHDLGLTERYRTSDQRFEIDAAGLAHAFLRERGIPEEGANRVWQGIALHATPEIPMHMVPEVELVSRGVELDVMGVGYDAIADRQREAVTATHPRPDFKNGILAAFTDGLRHRPGTTFGNVKADVLEHFLPGFRRGDFVEAIRDSAWPE